MSDSEEDSISIEYHAFLEAADDEDDDCLFAPLLTPKTSRGQG
jgi:hypothetical protein